MSIGEPLIRKILFFLPFYFLFKVLFLMYLWLPQFEGAKLCYNKIFPILKVIAEYLSVYITEDPNMMTEGDNIIDELVNSHIT